MYDNIGGKIKGLATTIFIVQAVLTVIAGLGIMAAGDEMILIGLLVMVLGPFSAWISSWLLYGFGELIDTACAIEENTRKDTKSNSSQAANITYNYAPNNKPVQKETTPIIEPKRKVTYSCLGIKLKGVKSHGVCAVCKASDVNLEKSEIKTEMGTRTLDICQNCYQEFYKASINK